MLTTRKLETSNTKLRLIEDDEFPPNNCFVCKRLTNPGETIYYLATEDTIAKGNSICFDFDCLFIVKTILDQWCEATGFTYIPTDLLGDTSPKWDA